MKITNQSAHSIILALFGALTLTCIPADAFSLRDARGLCKKHRFLILAAISAPVIYMYTHKLIKKAIKDYQNRHNENAQVASSNNQQEYCEGFVDSFIKTTKLVGTIFKVFRATTCPDEGKFSEDQWLDDFSQMA